jgi:hypothetical protein
MLRTNIMSAKICGLILWVPRIIWWTLLEYLCPQNLTQNDHRLRQHTNHPGLSQSNPKLQDSQALPLAAKTVVQTSSCSSRLPSGPWTSIFQDSMTRPLFQRRVQCVWIPLKMRALLRALARIINRAQSIINCPLKSILPLNTTHPLAKELST